VTDQIVVRLDLLRARLAAAATAALPALPVLSGSTAEDVGTLVDAMSRQLVLTTDPAEGWLLLAAAAGHLPLAADVEDLMGQVTITPSASEVSAHVLRHAALTIRDRGEPRAGLRVAVGTVVIDADHGARFNRHTGIQRVTRELCSRWTAAHEVELVAWTGRESFLRALATHEADRVLRWSGPAESSAADLAESAATDLVLPWRSTLVLPEIAQGATASPLAALAQYSGNAVVAVGYDAIPVTSAEMRPRGEPTMFVSYVTVIKHARRIAGISRSATAEFSGIARAVRAQGLPGPEVSEVLLAAEVPGAAGPVVSTTRPVVLCVGSHEPHKNHLALLHAAELCWREGLDFELQFIGGPGSGGPDFDPRFDALKEAGRPVSTLRDVTDDGLWAAYRSAAFTVFPSLHEGYGLPVAESVACGTPAITTGYGATLEIAERGGCLTVDPRDDAALAEAMRSLLTDPALLQRLRDEAVATPVRTWQAYADDLWQALVETEAHA